MTTNVPTVTYGANGFEIPSDEAILAGVIEDINDAFGGGLNPALDTPQGQLASSMAAIISNANQTFQSITRQSDPAFSSGRWQDGIARIYNIARNPSEPTVVQALCIGAEGVVIPVGATALAVDGNVYTCTEEGTIPNTGFVTLSFACNVAGPIACPADSLNQIYQAIPGWDSINNPSDGTIGTNTESRSEFEARRIASVALNSIGSLPSVLAAVLDVEGVLDAYVTENTAASSATIGGILLAANSLYVAVVGGLALDVATAIWSKKAPGCAYNGNTTVVVEDANSGYQAPYPSYSVKFETPAALQVIFSVNIANNAQVPADAVAQIKSAVIAAFSGADGGARARIGSTVYASRFYAGVAMLGAWVQIISIDVGSNNVSNASFTGVIAGTALTVSGVTGTIAIGQTVGDATGAVAPGTKIVSGAGSSWVVSIAQTVASEPMKTAVATANSTIVNINQVPSISADNITVTLS